MGMNDPQSTSPRIATVVFVRVPRGCAGQFGPHYFCTVPVLFKCGLTLKYHSSRAKKILRVDPRWAYTFLVRVDHGPRAKKYRGLTHAGPMQVWCRLALKSPWSKSQKILRVDPRWAHAGLVQVGPQVTMVQWVKVDPGHSSPFTCYVPFTS